jgi:hypothetical protein
MQKIGSPESNSTQTKYRRLKSVPKTIWPLLSGVVSRMWNVLLSRSCVIAPAQKIGAMKLIRNNCTRLTEKKVCVERLASSASEASRPPPSSPVPIRTSTANSTSR